MKRRAGQLGGVVEKSRFGEDLAAFLEWARGFDTIIDVRSPAEFAEDHVPGAISLPVLDDAERSRVGTLYTQDSPFVARKIGAALVARNAAAHIETRLMDHDGGWQPLVYCWRGGQRSGSFATILRQIGWRVQVVEGGYQAYRRRVVTMLYDTPLACPVMRLDGYTGTAKTALLPLLAERGVQVIDLEGLAGHRGSILGDVAGGQPSQKAFESAIAATLAGLDPERPVVVEAESTRIGALRVPPTLWAAMRVSPRLVVSAPLSARAVFLASAYGDLSADLPRLISRLDHLRGIAGHDEVARWCGLARAGDWVTLAGALVTHHYDPAYARTRGRDETPVLEAFYAPALEPEDLARLADRIARRVTAS